MAKSKAWEPVWCMECESSNIARVKYKPLKEKLLVEFHNGGQYVYSDFPPKEFLKFSKAESVGTFLNQHIKDIYPCKKVN